MGRPRKADRTSPIRQTIVEAAARLFASAGYHGASLAAIAREAGIKAPSLLYHFGSKDALYTEVVRRFYAQLSRSWRVALDDAEAARPEVVLMALRSLRELDGEQRDLLVTIVTELLRDGRAADVIEAAVVPLVDRLAEALDAAAPGPRPTRQIITLLIVAYVMNLDARRSMPEVDRLRSALFGDADHLDEIAVRLLR